MKWTSPVRRRRLDGVGEPMEVVLDDELLQTPPPRPRAPSRTKKSSEDTEEVTDEALFGGGSGGDAPEAPTHVLVDAGVRSPAQVEVPGDARG